MHEGVQTCARAAPVNDRQLLQSVGSARERGRTASLQSFKPPMALHHQGTDFSTGRGIARRSSSPRGSGRLPVPLEKAVMTRTAPLPAPPVAPSQAGRAVHYLDRRSALNRDERGRESPMVYGVIE